MSEIIIDREFSDAVEPLSEEEKAQLEQNLIEHGCRDPLVTWDGVLLDGHHRYEICQRRNIHFDTVEIELPDRDAALDWIDKNQLGRRNLTPDAFRYHLGRLYQRSKKSHGGDRKSSDQIDHLNPEKTAAKLSRAHGVSEPTVRRAAKFAEEVDSDPEMKEALKQRKPLNQIKKDKKKAERKKRIETLRESITETSPEGEYHVIVIDPPWRYQGGEMAHDPDGFRGVVDYPTMSLDEIASIELPSADDCVLWLWTTHRFMRHCFPMLDNWGFEEKAILTWAKPKMGIGRWLRSQTEYCIMAVKGSPTINLTNQTTILEAPLREHSRKPDEFYDMVDELCIGRKLDYFSRTPRSGWDQVGNDVKKF